MRVDFKVCRNKLEKFKYRFPKRLLARYESLLKRDKVIYNFFFSKCQIVLAQLCKLSACYSVRHAFVNSLFSFLRADCTDCADYSVSHYFFSSVLQLFQNEIWNKFITNYSTTLLSHLQKLFAGVFAIHRESFNLIS